jgi:hypothetical protein
MGSAAGAVKAFVRYGQTRQGCFIIDGKENGIARSRRLFSFGGADEQQRSFAI